MNKNCNLYLNIFIYIKEFKDTKIAKSALEYDNFDEEHEAKVKNREIVSTYSQLRGRSNSIDQGNTK